MKTIIFNFLKKFKLVLILVGFDFLTKIFFYLLLNNKDIIILIKKFLALYIVVNKSGLSPIHKKYYINNEFIIFISLTYLILAIYILLIKKIKIKKTFKIILGIFIFIFLVFLSFSLSKNINIKINSYIFVLLRGIGPLFLSIAILLNLKQKYLIICFSLFTAGNIGNYLSFFYPPFGVIDFLGQYSSQYNDYIFMNFADIYLFTFVILFLFYPIFILLKKIYNLYYKDQTKQLPLDNKKKEVE